MKSQLNELALFAGAGGGILGGKLLGWKTICAVEWDAYARDVLVARQNDGCLDPFPIWDDIQTFDGRPWRGRVDVVSGGFPCQDISAAGKGAGIEGERSGMWKHMARVIGEILPRFILVENSPMLVGRGLGMVLSDLAEMGYNAEWGIVGAHHVAAPHKRDRIWIFGELADSAIMLSDGGDNHAGIVMGRKPISESGNRDRSNNVADATSTQNDTERRDSECRWDTVGWNQKASQRDDRAPDNNRARGCCEIRDSASSGFPHRVNRSMEQPGTLAEPQRSDWWAAEPDVGRVAHGVAARVDRLRCIGNGQVSAVAALAWNLLTANNHD